MRNATEKRPAALTGKRMSYRAAARHAAAAEMNRYLRQHYYPCIARAEGAMPCYWIGEREMRGRDARRGERLRAREREREREDTGPQRRGGMCACVRRASACGTSAGHPAEPGSSIKNKSSSSALHPLVARRPATTASPSGGDRTRRGSARSCVCAIISAASALL